MVRRALGKQILHKVLCEYWSKSLESKLEKNANPPEFPAGNDTLCDLWGHIFFDDDKTPMLTTQQICQAVFHLRNGMAPGYDGMTAELWTMCDHASFCKCKDNIT